MTEKPLPLAIPPGVVTSESLLGASGRWADCSWVRFWHGKPQKVGGYVKLNKSGAAIGVPRGSTAWSDTATRQLVAVGTEAKLYMLSDVDYLYADITPWRATITAANPITVTAGSAVVNIAYPLHSANIGDYIDISGASDVDNFAPNGSWQIVSLPDANNLSIAAPNAALNTVTGGGAAVVLGLEISIGSANPTLGYGWGAGTWGEGTWGTPRSSSISFSARQWSMGSFGKVLISCPNGGGVYSFDPSVLPLTRAAIVATAPTACSGVVVTSDNIVIAYGSSLDPNTALDGGPLKQNLLQWWASAQGDYTNWDVTAVYGPNGSPSVSNTVREGTRFVGGVDLGTHVTLMWTDTALYAFQYTGSQYVFNVQLQGKECGLIGQQAMVQVSGEAYWMSPHGFKMYNGGVQNIPNWDDISEWVISNLRPFYTTKTLCWYNQRYDEIWWAFVFNNDTEPRYYVAVKRGEWTWTKGVLPESMSSATRFSGYDARPLVFGSDGDLYQLDNGLDADGAAAPWYLESAGFELSNGEALMEISGVAVDMQRQVGNVAIQVTTYDRSPASPVVLDQDSAAIAATDLLADLRCSGRIAKVRLSGGTALGDDFRLGVPKIMFGQGGARR